MAKECKYCGGTGESFGKFCTCAAGKLAKKIAEASKKAAEVATEEKKKSKIERLVDQQAGQQSMDKLIEAMSGPAFQLGEWVQVVLPGSANHGLIAFIVDFDKKQARIQAVKSAAGAKVNGMGWFNLRDLKALEIEADEEVLESLNKLEWQAAIDKALDEGDKEKFYELTGGRKGE